MIETKQCLPQPILVHTVLPIARVAGAKRVGDKEEGKNEGDWGERVSNVYYKHPLSFIFADAGVRRFPDWLSRDE